MRPMTRARTASSGMGSLAAIQPLLGAVLMLCVSLVQAAATTLRMILNRRRPDWHRQATHKDLPQATSGNHHKDPSGLPGSIPSLAPLIAPQQAQTLLPRARGRRTTHTCRHTGNQVGVCRHRRDPRRHALS